MHVAVANLKFVAIALSTPALFVGEYVGVFYTGSRLGHHIGDGVPPFLVVGGIFVFGGVLAGSIDLDEDKTRWVVGLLDYVETGDARLVDTIGGVLHCCSFEGFDLIGFDLYVDMDY